MIYFFDLRDNGEIVRLGYSKDGDARVSSHYSYGQKLLAVMCGSQSYESRLHGFFTKSGCSVAEIPESKSCYRGSLVWDYVEWLLFRGYASRSMDDLPHLPKLMWSVVNPAAMAQSPVDGGSPLLFPLGRRERIERAAKAAYHHSGSDEWYTPAPIVESARAVLGTIDLDPASCPAANRIVHAEAIYSARCSGLDDSHPWIGRVWMNPPYGDLAEPFAVRLVREYRAGTVPEAIALFNANAMTSRWFHVMYPAISALMLTLGRLKFSAGDPDQAFSSPSTGSVLLYFGANVDVFVREFSRHGQCLVPAQ